MVMRVVAIQLLCDMIRSGFTANYVTKNSAPRNVYFSMLRRDDFRLNYIRSLFKGSGSYVEAGLNYFDCLIVDKAKTRLAEVLSIIEKDISHFHPVRRSNPDACLFR